MDDNRKRALAAALQQIERQFGKGAIMRMGDGTHNNDIQVIHQERFASRHFQ